MESLMRLNIDPAFILALSVGLAGCGGGASNQERLDIMVPNAEKTIPVSGQVLVDGKPMKDLWVTLHPVDEKEDSLQPKAQTDTEGNFKITTYIGGDGAPEGDYKVTVEWLTYRQFGSSWVGPNKIDGPCGDMKTTEFAVTVGSEPVVIPTLDVKANPNAEKMKPKKGALAKEKHE